MAVVVSRRARAAIFMRVFSKEWYGMRLVSLPWIFRSDNWELNIGDSLDDKVVYVNSVQVNSWSWIAN